MIHTSSSKGFTLIDTLIALAIVAVIAVIGVASLSNVNKQDALTAEAEKIITLLTRARSLTLEAKNATVYGVHFETQNAVLFTGSTYTSGSVGNHIQRLNDAVKISSIALIGGGSDVLFQKLTGATSQSGTVRLSVTSNANASTTITIAGTGTAYSN